tara:strand:+ start:36778 stop:37101 length:324 start_codon:yes stop_codon:yes gene_type:complete
VLFAHRNRANAGEIVPIFILAERLKLEKPSLSDLHQCRDFSIIQLCGSFGRISFTSLLKYTKDGASCWFGPMECRSKAVQSEIDSRRRRRSQGFPAKRVIRKEIKRE